MASYRPIFLLCIAQGILLCILSISFQFIAMHRIDANNDNDLLASIRGNDESNANSASTSNNNKPKAKPVIAYVVTLTGCGNTKRYTKAAAMGLITQGAAVLHHSIQLAHSQSHKYDYKMYALIHPIAKECASAISKLGYTALIRNTPFDKADIQKEFLREHVDGASCCGAKEYIKLYAYTLVQHPVAVVLDLDSLVLQPLDELFDALILEDYDVRESVSNNNNGNHDNNNNNIPIHDGKNVTTNHRLPTSKNNTISAFYTRDYNMVNAGQEAYAVHR